MTGKPDKEKEKAGHKKTDETRKEPSTKKPAPEKAEAASKEKTASKLRCSTCGMSVESENVWVAFNCPACNKELITRCEKCKRLENSYTCQGCGFVGP